MNSFDLVVFIICVALIFDYINGFHDAANSIATVVSTKVLTPGVAVVMAAAFNFLAAYLLGTGVAATVGSGFVNVHLVTPWVLFAGLTGAILWDIFTWFHALPTSSSHALIGGYAGAAFAKAGFAGLVAGKWGITLAFLVLSPLIGMVAAYLLMVAVYWGFRKFTPSQMDRHFRRYQIVSAAFFSCAHGTNDAQKTMGIITAVLVAGGLQKDFHVPSWVIAASSAAIGLGTMSGGWRIVRTMGTRLTRLQPRSGFCAETGAAISILFATWLGLPVSSTHAIAGAIAGVGSIQRTRAVRWHVAGGIVSAWVLTIPAAAGVAAIVYCVIRFFLPGV
ncbi:MAG TPA: inorganic phosphate transporter [Bryobacteraceae bacterium]|jgi:PiT family inorganic phosphate transporter|nr:inorganic phosphate transporter [Bryobacteraceae bacterium]